MKTPPLALYAHFPWCVQKCPYCDFNSHTLRDELPEQRYVDALLRDLDAQAPDSAGAAAASAFFSAVARPACFPPPPSVASLTMRGHDWDSRATSKSRSRQTRARSSAADSPNTAPPGVTRVSLGAQSFDERQLKLLGRIHSADETRRAAEELHAAGLTNFNLDLMYALPGQTAEEAQADLRAALALAPAHICRSTT